MSNHKHKKRKKKVELPCDHNGTPIHIGDWLIFSDGPFHVETLHYYGEELVPVLGCCWEAEDENGCYCNNLTNGVVISFEEVNK